MLKFRPLRGAGTAGVVKGRGNPDLEPNGASTRGGAE